MTAVDTRVGCTLDRLIYIDDSGAEATGYVVYGWVEVAPCDWGAALRDWLTLRKQLAGDFGVPVTQELHATKFVNGRGEISKNPPVRYRNESMVDWKRLGRDVMLAALEAVRDCTAMNVGSAYYLTGNRGPGYAEDKFDTYTGLAHHFDRELHSQGSLGSIVMDGTDPHYRESHRTLDLTQRHVIEDPISHDSAVSQWTQIADLVSYTAYWSLLKPHGKDFGWDWYSDYLEASDRNGGPVPVAPRKR